MKIKDCLQWANVYPADVADFHRRHSDRALALQAYYRGDVDDAALREALSGYEPLSGAIKVSCPGPMYGLLRRHFGYPKNEARRIADEEAAHYEEARVRGLKPEIHIEVTASMDENGVPLDSTRTPFFSVVYDLTRVPNNEVRGVVEAVALAPDMPSVYDHDLVHAA